jgi:hypothetical protein
MAWLAELLLEFLRPILEFILGLFGYNLDWEPTDGRRLTGWPLVWSALFCFALSAVVCVGLFWLAWVVKW